MSQKFHSQLEGHAEKVADTLRAIGNKRRLLALCHLMETGEENVNRLAEIAGLGQSAMSQHLARMRDEGVVTFRRDSQTLWYRISDHRINELIMTLHRLYCVEGAAGRETDPIESILRNPRVSR